MAETKQQDAIEKELRINARPETVFQYFTDPKKMLQWQGLKAELDPRPGGIYRVDMNDRDVARGEYLEIVPNKRIVFTWGWEGSHVPPGSTTVEITLQLDGDGTIPRLRHTGLPEDQRDLHAQGWAHYLERLAEAASGGDPGTDPWAKSESPGA